MVNNMCTKNVIKTNLDAFDTIKTREKFIKTAQFEINKIYSNGIDMIKIYEAGDFPAVSFVAIVDGKEVYEVWQEKFEFYFNSQNYILAAAGFVEVTQDK